NYTVLSGLLRPGDRVLGMDLSQGGHLTHGSKAAYAGQYFDAHGYGLRADGTIDYDGVARQARELSPRMIICGATAHPRAIDFARFRQIGDEVGALVLADISHVAGLVIAGLHPSPIDHAHITTTCMHKQLFGPRGGLILMGRDAHTSRSGEKRTLAQELDRAVFPFSQGAPIVNSIAAKARALALSMTPAFRLTAERIVSDAKALARELLELGYQVVSGGTDNHIVLVDLRGCAVSGLVAERALEECHIVVNKNAIPGDPRPTGVTSGIRLGTNTMAYRGLGRPEMAACARLIDRVLRGLTVRDDRSYELPVALRDEVRASVHALAERFPIPGYPVGATS
ncbi:MAG TPA: serine hydroxymethyltransferase, partial [Kofleriaceae bacterium]|nr:serine hydroxymethyltransferase [Kofleriaceae bacterium]